MSRSFSELMLSSSAALIAGLGLLSACGSDDRAGSANAEAAEGEGGAPEGAPNPEGDPNGMSGTSGGAANPSTNVNTEANMGLQDEAPLTGAEDPNAGEPAPLLPPDQLELVEVVIPDTLPGCSPAFPHDPAVDEATGMVYYAGSEESCIGQYNPETGEFQAWPTATPESYPHGLLVLNGKVYFTGIDESLLGSVDPATGEAVDFPVDAVGPHTAVFHQGGIWFTDQRGGQFGRLDPSTGEAEVVGFSAANTGPYGIWPAPDGSLWVALFNTNRLARIDTAATPPTAEEIVLPEANARPRRIAVDEAGKVWFTDYARRALGLWDPNLPEAERAREFPTPGEGRPYGIAIGPDGRVWYNDQDAAEIVGFDQATETVVARLSLELEDPGPVRNIAVDQPRRRLWLAISNVGRLAMIQF